MLERVSREIFDISAIEKRSKKMEQTSKIAIKMRYKKNPFLPSTFRKGFDNPNIYCEICYYHYHIYQLDYTRVQGINIFKKHIFMNRGFHLCSR